VDWINITINGRRVFHKGLLFLEGLGKVGPESRWIGSGLPFFLGKELGISTVGVESLLEEGTFVCIEGGHLAGIPEVGGEEFWLHLAENMVRHL
jgi:hypothetical protein